jgi:tetratricopeptide (TPR) repeat protein
MHRVILYAAAVLIAFGIAAAPAAADDLAICVGPGNQDAIAACSRLIQGNPRNSIAYASRGFAYELKGDVARAIADYDQAIRLNPTDARIYALTYTRRGMLHYNKGDHERAIADYDQAIRINPMDTLAYAARGYAYAQKGNYGRAMIDLDQAIKLDPNNAAAHNTRGFAYNNRGDYDRAISDLDQAIRLDSNNAAAYNNRGFAYERKRDYARAIADYDQAIRLNPTSTEPRENRQRAQAALASSASPPGAADEYDACGKAEGDNAIAACSHLIQRDPKNAAAYTNRGRAYSAKNDDDRAVADYNQAIRLEPKNAVAYSARGLTYTRRWVFRHEMRDFDRAIADHDQAIKLDPKDANAYSSRGLTYYAKADYDHAIADYDQAIRLNPKDAVTYNSRGLVYHAKADYAHAIADFDQALNLNPALTIARENRARAAVASSATPGKSPLAPPSQVGSPVVTSATPSELQGPHPSRLDSPIVTAERRVALVIGNSEYRSVPFLPNPRRDAAAVADALRQVGFQSVELVIDLDRDRMVKALRSFRDQADKADWALIYFAGHGIEIDRVNYLIPVDARLVDDRDVNTETVSYEELLSTIGGARALRLVILDACRVNPFKERMRRTNASRSGTDRGLARPPESEPGTLVVYSAKDGEVAADDVGGVNSPFARAFVGQLKVPGREVRRLFDFVRDDVLDATNKRQQPFTYGSLPGRRDFYFVSAQ